MPCPNLPSLPLKSEETATSQQGRVDRRPLRPLHCGRLDVRPAFHVALDLGHSDVSAGRLERARRECASPQTLARPVCRVVGVEWIAPAGKRH